MKPQMQARLVQYYHITRRIDGGDIILPICARLPLCLPEIHLNTLVTPQQVKGLLTIPC